MVPRVKQDPYHNGPLGVTYIKTMATNKASLASGAEPDAQSARRRNVPSTSPASPASSSGILVDRVEVDEKRNKTKKVRMMIL